MPKNAARLRRTINVVLAFAVVAVGTLTTTWLIATGPKPAVQPPRARVHSVAALPVIAQESSAPVIGHGTVRPKRQVNVIPQVGGKLLFVHQDMGEGKIIPKDELLFKVDPLVYESRVRQVEAEVRGLKGALARHETERLSLVERLETARRRVEIAKENFETSKTLRSSDTIVQPVLLADEQTYLAQKDISEQLESQLERIPHLKTETQAQLDAALARLEQAKYDLKNTELLCPFEARVEEVRAHKSQVVTAHLSIATLTDMEAFEISVSVDPRETRWLVEEAQPATLEQADLEEPAEVVVRASGFGREIRWRGFVTRFERMDESTRTARLVVEVRNADMSGIDTDGLELPSSTLSIGMFCRTELPTRTLKDALFVPRHAVHDSDRVYVFEPDAEGSTTGRLAARRVPVLRSVGDDVLVDYAGRRSDDVCELAAGEQVIVSPLLKPVVGMRIQLRDQAAFSADARLPASLPAQTAPNEHPLLAGLAPSPGAAAGFLGILNVVSETR